MKVLITGASHGIGKYTAFEFAKNKASLYLTYHIAEKEAQQVKERCYSLGAKEVNFYRLDLGKHDSILMLAEKIEEIDVLINNAGVLSWKPLKEQTLEEIENQVRVNLEGLIKLTKVLLPKIRDKIINISSGAGKTGFEGLSVYCATKFGVRGFTQALREELAPEIEVISVNPGMTKTRMTDYQGVEPERVARVIYLTAIGKIKPDSQGDVDVWKFL